MGRNTWREAEDRYLAVERRQLERSAAVSMGEWLRDLREWDVFVNPATFDPFEVAGAGVVTCRPATASRAVGTDGSARAHLLTPRVSEATAMRRFGYFLNKAETIVGRPVEGVMALEQHKSGQPHGHGLLSIHGGLRMGDVRKLSRLWRGYRGNGHVIMSAPRSLGDVAGYCAKYMTKDVGEIVFSNGLGRRLR